MHRAQRARTALVTAVLITALLIGAGVGSGADAAVREGSDAQIAKVLGKRAPAKGTAVKIGLVTPGASANIDGTDEEDAAHAMVEWINEYKEGIAGRPIELVVCVDQASPAKALDCSNEMIQNDVAAVMIGQNGVAESIWTPLHAAGIPVFNYGSSNTKMMADPTSTFMMINPQASLVNLPAAIAKKTKSKTLSAVIIEVPAATEIYRNAETFKKLGVDIDLVPVPAGTADMTPQMQRVASSNPDGAVVVVGNDAFCTAAFNGLRTAGFEGPITGISQCFSDATRAAVPADFLEGMQISAQAPLNDKKNPSTKLFNAVLDKYLTSEVDRTAGYAIGAFITFAGFDAATSALKGAVTPETIVAATKAMPWSELPGTGGLHFRCNGKASPTLPAVCSTGINSATLDAEGKASKYKPVADEEIPA